MIFSRENILHGVCRKAHIIRFHYFLVTLSEILPAFFCCWMVPHNEQTCEETDCRDIHESPKIFLYSIINFLRRQITRVAHKVFENHPVSSIAQVNSHLADRQSHHSGFFTEPSTVEGTSRTNSDQTACSHQEESKVQEPDIGFDLHFQVQSDDHHYESREEPPLHTELLQNDIAGEVRHKYTQTSNSEEFR